MGLLKKVVFCSLFLLSIITLLAISFYNTVTLKNRDIREMKTLINLTTTTYYENLSFTYNITNLTTSRHISNKPKTMKTILFYTTYFAELPWPQTIGREKNLTDYSGLPCKVAACNFSISKDDISRSHVVIFHGYSTPPPKDMKELILKKPKGQMWAWFNEESPVSTYAVPLDNFQKMFELTITYREDSDVRSAYGEYFKLDETSRAVAEKHYPDRNFAARKDRLVLWFAGNCVSLRLNVVKEIAKYIQVDVYGGCQSHFKKPPGSCHRRTPECNKVAERYKFYLAIENSRCKQYVTEKYWENALERNIVPVVIAGSYNKDVLIPGSYIDILDFPSAIALANYLKYLDKNDTAYNNYFEWKKKYSPKESNWICDLCELLHKNYTPKKDFWDLSKYWGIKENCNVDDARIRYSWLNETDSKLQP